MRLRRKSERISIKEACKCLNTPDNPIQFLEDEDTETIGRQSVSKFAAMKGDSVDKKMRSRSNSKGVDMKNVNTSIKVKMGDKGVANKAKGKASVDEGRSEFDGAVKQRRITRESVSGQDVHKSDIGEQKDDKIKEKDDDTKTKAGDADDTKTKAGDGKQEKKKIDIKGDEFVRICVYTFANTHL